MYKINWVTYYIWLSFYDSNHIKKKKVNNLFKTTIAGKEYI